MGLLEQTIATAAVVTAVATTITVTIIMLIIIAVQAIMRAMALPITNHQHLLRAVSLRQAVQ